MVGPLWRQSATGGSAPLQIVLNGATDLAVHRSWLQKFRFGVCSRRIFRNHKYREMQHLWITDWVDITIVCMFRSFLDEIFEEWSWHSGTLIPKQGQPRVANTTTKVPPCYASSSASQFQECKKTFEGSASFYSVDDQPCCGPCAGVVAE